MLTAKQIRESFKDFFAQKGHKIVPSAPMVVKDDLTLMFTNAGMNRALKTSYSEMHRRVIPAWPTRRSVCA